MPKIKSDDEYRDKIEELNKEGVHVTEHASERQKRLEGETADYAQGLHGKETRGRPRSPDQGSLNAGAAPSPGKRSQHREKGG